MRSISPALLVVALLGCLAEPESELVCFEDGESFLDPSRRPEGPPPGALPWSALTDVCCEPGAPGDEACRAFYRDHDSFAGRDIEQLAVCSSAGACQLECIPGENCACVTDRDCGGATCSLLGRADDEGACAAQEQTGEQTRCTVCQAD